MLGAQKGVAGFSERRFHDPPPVKRNSAPIRYRAAVDGGILIPPQLCQYQPFVEFRR